MIGLLPQVAVVPLAIIMLTAIATTKVPILMEQGFWKMAHEARTDWSMLLGSVFLLIVGAGSFSLDARVSRVRVEHRKCSGHFSRWRRFPESTKIEAVARPLWPGKTMHPNVRCKRSLFQQRQQHKNIGKKSFGP